MTEFGPEEIQKLSNRIEMNMDYLRTALNKTDLEKLEQLISDYEKLLYLHALDNHIKGFKEGYLNQNK